MTDIAQTDYHKPAPDPRTYRPAEAPQRRLLSPGTVASLLVLALLISIPMYSKGFFVFQMTQMLVYATAVLGLNLLTGINGQFSLGHSAFFAIGAYTCAILVELGGVNYMATIPIAGIVAFGFGFLFAFPALRLEGLYLALATFALAVATPQLLKLHAIEHWTGGVQGLVMFQETFDVPVPFGLNMDPGIWTFYLTLFVFAVVFMLALALVNSRTGRAMMAIRDNPIAARSMGISLPYYKATAFGVSALVTGIAGAMNAIVIKFVAPDSFTFVFAVLILVGMVIGGVGWLQGCIIGGLAMLYLPNIAEIFDNVILWFASTLGFADALPSGNAMQQQFIRLSGVIYGVILVLFIYLAPSGAGGLIRATVNRVKRMMS